MSTITTRTNRATPMSLVRATGREPFGLMPVSAAKVVTSSTTSNHVSQVTMTNLPDEHVDQECRDEPEAKQLCERVGAEKFQHDFDEVQVLIPRTRLGSEHAAVRRESGFA